MRDLIFGGHTQLVAEVRMGISQMNCPFGEYPPYGVGVGSELCKKCKHHVSHGKALGGKPDDENYLIYVRCKKKRAE